MIHDATTSTQHLAEPQPDDSSWPDLAHGVQFMVDEARTELDDITKAKVPLLKAISIIIFVGGLIWWARGLQGSVEGMARDLSGLSTSVGKVLDMKSDLTSAEGRIDTMQRELSDLRENYKVLQLKYDRLDKDFAVATAKKGD